MDSLSVGKDADIIAVSDNPLDGITVHLKWRFCFEFTLSLAFSF